MIQTDYSTLTIENHRMYARLRDHQFSLYEDYARKRGLQGKSLLILLWIYRHPKGISQQTITRHTYSTKQVVNAVIKNFSKKGYIKSTVHPKDRRKKLIMLTDNLPPLSLTLWMRQKRKHFPSCRQSSSKH